MITHQIENSGLIRVSITGNTSPDDLIQFLDEFSTWKDLGSSIKLLYDLRDAILEFGIEGLQVITQKAEEVTAKYERVRTAFLVDKPMQTAFSLIFSHSVPSNRTKREVFSSESAALDWLMV